MTCIGEIPQSNGKTFSHNPGQWSSCIEDYKYKCVSASEWKATACVERPGITKTKSQKRTPPLCRGNCGFDPVDTGSETETGTGTDGHGDEDWVHWRRNSATKPVVVTAMALSILITMMS